MTNLVIMTAQGLALILLAAIVIPVGLVIAKKVYIFLGGLNATEPDYDKELVARLKSNIVEFTNLHNKIKADMRKCNNAEIRILRRDCGSQLIDTLDTN